MSTRGICGAKTRRGGKCHVTALYPNGRCRVHGGATPSGPASPHFKTGRYSRIGLLPANLASHYARTSAQLDQELLALVDEIALIDARIGEMLALSADGRHGQTIAPEGWKHLEGLIEQRRKLVETETKRRKETQETLSIVQVRAILSAVAAAIHAHVTNLQERAAVAMELRKLLKRNPGEQPEIQP